MLPFEQLTWENFERLCLRIARQRGNVEHALDHARGDNATGRMSARDAQAQGRLYGTLGQRQQGIDLYVRESNTHAANSPQAERSFLSLQSRRIEKLSDAKLRAAVADFLKGGWATVSRTFVYATSLSAVRTQYADEIKKQTDLLAGQGIRFEVWDAEELSAWLRSDGLPAHESQRSRIVDDFFGRAWVERFLGPEVAESFKHRLDAAQVAQLKEQMARHYRVAFSNADSGTVSLRSRDAPRLALTDRFVVPDMLATTSALAATSQEALATDNPAGTRRSATWSRALDSYREAQGQLYPHNDASFGADPLSAAATALPEPTRADQRGVPIAGARTRADVWLGSADRHVVVGAAGSGKSTLLRFAVLDLLSDAPTLAGWAERFGDRLPVWFPFHFFTRRRSEPTGGEASVQSTLRAWLKLNDAAQLWDLVSKALDDDRLLLIVDGLDEWVDEDAGRACAYAIANFLDERQLPAVISTRPYGLQHLPDLPGEWQYGQLAPLSDDQQRQLVTLWFCAARTEQTAFQAAQTEGAPDPSASAGRHIDRQVSDFLDELRDAPDISPLTRVPLFLLLLVGLKLAGMSLPTHRFDVYESATTLLLADHPAARATASGAMLGGRTRMRREDVRTTLAHLAFIHQERGDLAGSESATVRKDIVRILRDEEFLALTPDQAAHRAPDFVDLAEGELGVLVPQGPRQLGFLHRVLQEHLAAEYIANNLPTDRQRELVAQHAADPLWREVLLGVLWRTTRPAEARELATVLAARADQDGYPSLAARELLAEAVFIARRLPAPEAHRHARAILDAIESHPHFAHRQRLLPIALAGMRDPELRTLVTDRLPRWAIATDAWPAQVTYSLPDLPADDELYALVESVLASALSHDDHMVAYVAAERIGTQYRSGDRAQDLMGKMLAAIRRATTAKHAAVVIRGLQLGWPSHPQTQAILAHARAQDIVDLRLVALAALLGVLEGPLKPGAAPPASAGIAQGTTREERAWLVDLLRVNGAADSTWRYLAASCILAVAKDDPALSEQILDLCLGILNLRTRGDRDLAWAVVLRGYHDEPAVVDRLCNLLGDDESPLLSALSAPLELLAHAFAGNTEVAAAIEDALTRSSHRWWNRELFLLARIDHGPAMRTRLLEDLRISAVPHWAAEALVEHWADDLDVIAALRQELDDDSGRAWLVMNAALPVLGPAGTITRIEQLLAAARQDMPDRGVPRLDHAAQALRLALDAQEDVGILDAESVAAAFVSLLASSRSLANLDAEADVILSFPDTGAVRGYLPTVLARPRPPWAQLFQAYKHDPVTLARLTQQAAAVHKGLPAPLRQQLCLHLRDQRTDGALIRQITSRWPHEFDSLAQSAASAAFHTHLARDHAEGNVPVDEWDAACSVLRTHAVADGLQGTGARQAAWLGILLIDRLDLLDDLVERADPPQPSQVPLGEVGRDVNVLLLSQIAERWNDLRSHFGDSLISRLSGGFITQAMPWDHLALVAEREPQLSRDLAAAVGANFDLLAGDGTLAWYASVHRGESGLLDVLFGQLGQDSMNARGLASFLLSDPHTLGVDPDMLHARVCTHISPDLPYISSAYEILADAFPNDPLVQAAWRQFTDAATAGTPHPIHPCTRLALAYAATPATDILAQLARDEKQLANHDMRYFAPQLTRAVVRRLHRDNEARDQFTNAILNQATQDGRAAQLTSYLTSTAPLEPAIADDIQRRHHRHSNAAIPDYVCDYPSNTDLAVPELLLRLLDQGNRHQTST